MILSYYSRADNCTYYLEITQGGITKRKSPPSSATSEVKPIVVDDGVLVFESSSDQGDSAQ